MAGDTSLYKLKEVDVLERLDLFKAQWLTPTEYRAFLNSIYSNEEQIKELLNDISLLNSTYIGLGVNNDTQSLKVEEDFQKLGVVKQRKDFHSLFKLNSTTTEMCRD